MKVTLCRKFFSEEFCMLSNSRIQKKKMLNFVLKPDIKIFYLVYN